MYQTRNTHLDAELCNLTYRPQDTKLKDFVVKSTGHWEFWSSYQETPAALIGAFKHQEQPEGHKHTRSSARYSCLLLWCQTESEPMLPACFALLPLSVVPSSSRLSHLCFSQTLHIETPSPLPVCSRLRSDDDKRGAAVI